MTDRAPAAPLFARIEAELADRNLDMQWLEQQSGVRRSTIHRWKTNPRHPRAITVNKVAKALSLDPVEARRLAGIEGSRVDGEGDPLETLAEVDTDVLLEEIRRRIPD